MIAENSASQKKSSDLDKYNSPNSQIKINKKTPEITIEHESIAEEQNYEDDGFD